MHTAVTSRFGRVVVIVVFTLLGGIVPRVDVRAEDPMVQPAKPLEPELFAAINHAEMIFTAKIRTIDSRPFQAAPSPSRFLSFITFDDATMLRGTEARGATFAFHSPDKPSFGKGADVIAAGYSRPGPPGMRSYLLNAVLPGNDEERQRVKMAMTLPVGWSLENDVPVSPWSKVKGPLWDVDTKTEFACSQTKRPAWTCGPNVTLTVEKVPAKQAFEPNKIPPGKPILLNRDGDGKFKLTVTNTGDVETQIPALRTDGKKTYWADSVVILVPGEQSWNAWRPLILDGTGSPIQGTRPVTLKPGESTSGVINALQLQDYSVRPAAAQQVLFRFCLGELSWTEDFSYANRHHDKFLLKKKP